MRDIDRARTTRNAACRLLVVQCIVLTVAASAMGGRARAGEKLEAGVATVEITPPVGYRMSGYFHERLSTGTHDPLLAKALVLAQGDVAAAIVCCDVVGISLEVSQAARKMAAEQTGIPAEQILIAATHSHTGPLYFGALRQEFKRRTVAEHGSDVHETVDYSSWLAERLAEAIADAHTNRQTIELAAGVGRQTGLSFNRRFHMRDGSVRCNPGKLNPDIVRVAGPIDPDVGLLAFRPAGGGEPLAVFSVFALHLDTVGGTEYAGDYPFYVQELLHERLGESVTSFFAAGTCGDINHVDVSHDRPQKGHAEAQRIGTALGETVLATLPELTAVAEPELAIAGTTVALPLQQYDEDEISQARLDIERVDSRELSSEERVRAYKIMALELRGGDTLDAEVQVVRLSHDVALVALPGEVFVDLGLAIKRASPFRTTLVMELTNDAPGYVPTLRGFAEGSYETINSRIAPGGGERLVEEAVKLLDRLHAPIGEAAGD